MSLKFGGSGTATGYISMPVGTFKEESALFRRQIEDLRKRRSKVGNKPDRLLYVLGQADMAVQIEVLDFRRVFELNYPGSKSTAATVNWVFSVPFSLGHPVFSAPRNAFQFLLHLKFRRDIFAYRGIEETIVNRILALGTVPGAARPFVTSIHAGLGWSDFIVEGWFDHETYEHFAPFVIAVHGLNMIVGDGPALSVLQRILTIVAYDPESPPPPKGARHMTFVRTFPGKYDEVYTVMEKFGGKIHILDGKADFAIVAESASTGFVETQRDVAEDKNNRTVIQKLETHLMFLPAEALVGHGKREDLVVAQHDNRVHVDCSCVAAHALGYEKITAALARLNPNLLPRELRYAIDNVLFLLGSTLRETSVCCDSRSAAFACYEALLGILDGLRTDSEKPIKNEGLEFGNEIAIQEALIPGELKRYADVAASIRRIDEWHRFVELLLRQRTVGSYEEILGQTDRAVVYNGGVQKFLYLADSLVNDFARKIDPDARTFATIYDSVKTVLGIQGTGLIRIPTHNLFDLPLAVSDLWHEVGAYFFFQHGGARYTEEIPSDWRREFIAQAHDHYGDLLVFLFGFSGDLRRFVTSLAAGWVEAYGGVSRGVQLYSLRQFMLRLYLVVEFSHVRSVRKLIREEPIDQTVEANFIAHRIKEMKQLLLEYGRGHRYGALEVPENYWQLLVENVTDEPFESQRGLYHDWCDVPVSEKQQSVKEFENGEMVEFDDDSDLNGYFASLAHMLQAPNRSLDIEAFAMMAALGKSASTEYHRRQMTKPKSL
jgi:hypothetical protein